MTRKKVFKPSPRRYVPPPAGELDVRPPFKGLGEEPEFPTANFISGLTMGVLLIVVMSVAKEVFPSLPGGLTTMIYFLLFPIAGTGVTVIVYLYQKHRYSQEGTRLTEAYEANPLNVDIGKIKAAHEEYKEYLVREHPPLERCRFFCEDRTPDLLWARRQRDPDFMELRLGTGNIPFPRPIKLPDLRDDAGFTTQLIKGAHKVVETHKLQTLKDAPITIPLAQSVAFGIAGQSEDVLNLLRILIIQAATHHSPDSMRLFLLSVHPIPDPTRWDWVHWLPHIHHDAGDQRAMAFEESSLNIMLDSIHDELQQRQFFLQDQRTTDTSTINWPHLFVIVDNASTLTSHAIMNLIDTADPRLGATFVFTALSFDFLPRVCRRFVEFDYRTVEPANPEASRVSAALHGFHNPPLIISTIDNATLNLAEQVSRFLAPVVMQSTGNANNLPNLVSLLDLFEVTRVEQIDLSEKWSLASELKPYETLTAPVGKTADGKRQFVDLHRRLDTPSAERGHGPHAVVAGSTGSGKSQMIMSLIISIAVHYRPDEVNFVIVDFKPPGIDKILESLPHVKNFTDILDVNLVPRAFESLGRELGHRSQIFKQTGVSDIDDYIRYRREGREGFEAPLPYLILLVDEFTTLKNELPEQLKSFEDIAMRGRAYGFLMMLMAQSPPISPQVATNTFLRLCLKSTPDVSRDVIGTTDAANLKRAGATIMRVGAGDIPERYGVFQAAYAGGNYIVGKDKSPVEGIHVRDRSGRRNSLVPDTSPEDGTQHGPQTHESIPRSQLQVLVEYIKDKYTQLKGENALNIKMTRQPWQEPIDPDKIDLDSCRIWDGPLKRKEQGWNGNGWDPTSKRLTPIIGIVDAPQEQRQFPLEIEFENFGHLLICCNTNMDRQMTLRALMMSLMLDHSPSEIHLYGLDLGNYNLEEFKDFPHVGSIISVSEKRKLERFFKWIAQELDDRKRRRTSNSGVGIDGQDTPKDPAIIVVIDNLGRLFPDTSNYNTEYEIYRSVIAQLGDEGAAADIYLAATTTPDMRGIGNITEKMNRMRLCLRLDKNDYRTLIGFIPDYVSLTSLPGRGLFLKDGVNEVQLATLLKSSDGSVQTVQAIRSTSAYISDMKQTMRKHCEQTRYRTPVEIQGALPDRIAYSQLVKYLTKVTDYTSIQMLLGLDDADLNKIYHWNLVNHGPHFVVTGPTSGGKTTALKTMVQSLNDTCTKDQLKIILVDSDTNKLALLKGMDLVGDRHITGLQQLEELLVPITQELESRARWKQSDGLPRYLIVIDDYDTLVQDYSGGEINSFQKELARCARQYSKYGLHFVVALNSVSNLYDPHFLTFIKGSKSICFVGDPNLSFTLEINGSVSRVIANEARDVNLVKPGQSFVLTRSVSALVQIAEPDTLNVNPPGAIILEADSSNGSPSTSFDDIVINTH